MKIGRYSGRVIAVVAVTMSLLFGATATAGAMSPGSSTAMGAAGSGSDDSCSDALEFAEWLHHSFAGLFDLSGSPSLNDYDVLGRLAVLRSVQYDADRDRIPPHLRFSQRVVYEELYKNIRSMELHLERVLERNRELMTSEYYRPPSFLIPISLMDRDRLRWQQELDRASEPIQQAFADVLAELTATPTNPYPKASHGSLYALTDLMHRAENTIERLYEHSFHDHMNHENPVIWPALSLVNAHTETLARLHAEARNDFKAGFGGDFDEEIERTVRLEIMENYSQIGNTRLVEEGCGIITRMPGSPEDVDIHEVCGPNLEWCLSSNPYVENSVVIGPDKGNAGQDTDETPPGEPSCIECPVLNLQGEAYGADWNGDDDWHFEDYEPWNETEEEPANQGGTVTLHSIPDPPQTRFGAWLSGRHIGWWDFYRDPADGSACWKFVKTTSYNVTPDFNSDRPNSTFYGKPCGG